MTREKCVPGKCKKTDTENGVKTRFAPSFFESLTGWIKLGTGGTYSLFGSFLKLKHEKRK